MASIKHKSQEKYMNIISDLLKREDNKYCVDCGSRGPRWASCTLGVFLCIQCAIIHRNMGVHLSRIKSVDYDNWTSQQVDTMVKIGNSRGRAIYEASLGNNFLRPQNKCELDKFIRSKYEHKLYVKKEQISPTATPKERKLKQNPNDKKVNSKMILSKQENIVTPISVKIIKEHDVGSARKPLTVLSSANSNTLVNNINRVTNSSALSNNNVPTNNLMNPRNNSVLTSQPEISQDNAADNDDDDEFGEFISSTEQTVFTEPLEISSSENSCTPVNYVDPVLLTSDMSQNSDNITDNDDFGDFVSVPQPSIPNLQTSTSSATELFTIPHSENRSVTGYAIGTAPNLSTSININALGCQNSIIQSNFESQGYASSQNNYVVPEQINTNNTAALQQLINNFVAFGQSLISLSQLVQYNLFETSLLENRDSNVHVPIPESQDEFSTDYSETLEDLGDIEMSQLSHILSI